MCILCGNALCDHYGDVDKALQQTPGYEGYHLENLRCPVCLGLVTEPMVMDNGLLIDYLCLKDCMETAGGYDPQNPVTVAVPSILAKDEIERLLALAGTPLTLPRPRPVLRRKDTFEEVLERRRFRIPNIRIDLSFDAQGRPLRAADLSPEERAARLMPRNQEVRVDEEVRLATPQATPLGTPVRNYRTFIPQVNLTPDNLYEDFLGSDDTVDTTEMLAEFNPHEYI